MNVPEKSCPTRNVRFAAVDDIRLKSQKITTSSTKAAPNAIVGAMNAGMITLWARLCHWTPPSPDCAMPAPTRPPIRACDELDGRPSHHVARFHAIAPNRAARTVFVVTRLVSSTPLPTVFATAVVTNAPTRLATAAIATATRGGSARVEIEVATALAVSWKPLVKSNPSRSEEHTSELQSHSDLVCRLLLEKKNRR